MSDCDGGSELRVGLVVEGTDHFLQPIETELRLHYMVGRFEPRFVRLPFVGRRVNEWLLERQLQRFLVDHDVVFFEWVGPLLIMATGLPKAGHIVARMHSFELATTAQQVDWSSVETLVVLTDVIRRRLEDVVSGIPSEVMVIPNGVDLTRFLPSSRSFGYRLGMVCNLLPIKRVYEMILCLYQLRKDGFPFTLSVAGEFRNKAPRYAWAINSLIEKLGLSSYVDFPGYVNDVARWLRHVDIFVSNSYWEGQQVALLEAMASGCYCLSHCWAGAEEVLPAENIFVTDDELRSKLIAYAKLAEDEKHQAQARMRAITEEKFDERRMVREIVELVERVGRDSHS